ncbi:MAG TPA: bifunctional DNA-formamidopyrimidine glycosylase/DNA-(apurinic or apyrimidinic site) lyase [Patescibacteria group bacterium]|nr:bifunctional DNA-formamidopyrimidine glycosylase/DNA-(apurinic or apyrimidinic site) lyase [Patescibacteria group bacterium]
MPELPEVETIKRDLQELIAGNTIKTVTINLAKQVKAPRAKFLELVQGQKIKAVRRRAKMIIFDLQNGWYLLFHLKMTGQLIYRGYPSVSRQARATSPWQGEDKMILAGGGHPIKYGNAKDKKSGVNMGSLGSARDKLLINLPNKYSHVVFNFQDGSHLFFNDLRQFGWVKLLDGRELEKLDKEFGIEPLEKEFTFKKFKELLVKKQNKVIKPLLMEQDVIAGVGNIYAQEACFCAGVMPSRRVKDLSEQELNKLYVCLVKILKLAVAKKGTSSDNYVDAFGRQGNMVKYLKVYDRKGEKCRRCGVEIKVMKQGSRTTAYCPGCQR